MVDYTLFEKILKNEDGGYIEHGDFISHDLIELFLSSKVEKVKSLFKPSTGGTYFVEFKCERCGSLVIESFTKTKLYDYLQHLRGNSKFDSKHYFCYDCQQAFKEEELAKTKRINEEIIRREIEDTQVFIDIYLNPEKCWKNTIKNWRKLEELKSYSFNRTVVANYIKHMDYKNFLQTPYWKAIAERVKYRAKNKCQLCNGTENLNVHHRSYEHHGEELYHMEDLICICQNCHQKHHFE